jgi:hypothetical protein
MEAEMQSLGKVLLTGAAVVVLWKVMVGLFAGVLLLAMKVGLVLFAVYFILKLFNGKKDEEE